MNIPASSSQCSHLENSGSASLPHSDSSSVLNHVVPAQSINVFGIDLFELTLNDHVIASMRGPSDAPMLLQTAPLNIRKMNLPEASIRARENWAKAFAAVRQLVKGAFKDCLVIKEGYYPEALDPRHEYMGAQQDYFCSWRAAVYNKENCHSNYFQLLELFRRPLCPSDISEDGKLVVQDDQRYVTDSDNRIIKHVLLNRSWVFTGRENGLLATGVYQCSPEEAQSYFGTVIMRGKIVFSSDHCQKNLLASSQHPTEFIFVSDQHNVMYAGIKVRKVFHHSSFLSGKPVAMAGALTISPSGELLGVDNYSGHYQPTADHCYKFLLQLEINGVDLRKINFTFWNHNLQSVFHGPAIEWLGRYERGDFNLYG
jgi:hypothetical protein